VVVVVVEEEEEEEEEGGGTSFICNRSDPSIYIPFKQSDPSIGIRGRCRLCFEC
jgi:hypothetical protein